MSPTSLLLLLLSTTQSLLILDKLAKIKDSLVSKVLGGKENCGCPCREYNVLRCDLEWVEHCYQEHYHTKCQQRQAYKPRLVRQISRNSLKLFGFASINNSLHLCLLSSSLLSHQILQH